MTATTSLRTALLAAVLATLPLLGQPDLPAAASITVAASPEPAGTWPLDPRPEVVAGFDPPTQPWGPGHRGVDLAGRVGQPVRAALDGTVTWAGPIAGKGVVTVSHGETRTTYEPVAASVSVGEPVRAGQQVGVLEVPFSHCFPAACLHWGLLRGETYLDPLSLVGGGPVRLLPLWRDEPVQPTPRPRASRWRPPRLPYAEWRPRSVTW